LNIGKLCEKFGIADLTWKSAMNMIVQHLLLSDLFPKYENSGFDLVANIMETHRLKAKDISGEIYATVSSY